MGLAVPKDGLGGKLLDRVWRLAFVAGGSGVDSFLPCSGMRNTQTVVFPVYWGEVADDEDCVSSVVAESEKADHAGFVVGVVDPLEGVWLEVAGTEGRMTEVEGVEVGDESLDAAMVVVL